MHTYSVNVPSLVLVTRFRIVAHRKNGCVQTGTLIDRRGHGVLTNLTLQSCDLSPDADPNYHEETHDRSGHSAPRVSPGYEHPQGEKTQGYTAHHAVERQGYLKYPTNLEKNILDFFYVIQRESLTWRTPPRRSTTKTRAKLRTPKQALIHLA